MTRDQNAPGYGRDEDMEDARVADRPAASNLSADEKRGDDPAPNEHITVSPDPDEDG